MYSIHRAHILNILIGANIHYKKFNRAQRLWSNNEQLFDGCLTFAWNLMYNTE